MRFLVDHNLSPRLARSLNEVVDADFGDQVVALKDKFPVDTSDVDWMNSLAAEGSWCFISADYRIKRSPVERAALRKSRLTGFYLSKGLRKKELAVQAARLLLQWKTISTQSRLVSGAALFEVLERGRLKQMPF